MAALRRSPPTYGAAIEVLGCRDKQEVGRRANIRVENRHLPFRRRERAMLRFRAMRASQQFAAVPADVHNHFASDCHLVSRQADKKRRKAALAEWRALAS